jgi:hypothetical protein
MRAIVEQIYKPPGVNFIRDGRFRRLAFVVWSSHKGGQKMANFLLLYTGGAAPTPADRDKIMQQWGGWMAKLGDKFVDAGNPLGRSKNLSNGGAVHDGAAQNPAATGYSILKADSLTSATELAKGCPVLLSGGKVTVYEITPAM